MQLAQAHERPQNNYGLPVVGIPLAEIASLDEVLEYKHEGLVERLENDLKISREEADLLFLDLKKFLFLCGSQRKNAPHVPPAEIDEAWHTFLLFSRDYRDFCLKYFGVFIHHRPFTKREKVGRGNSEMLLTQQRAAALFPPLSKNWGVVGLECAGDCSQSCNPDYGD